jgi:hypothetical protein
MAARFSSAVSVAEFRSPSPTPPGAWSVNAGRRTRSSPRSPAPYGPHVLALPKARFRLAADLVPAVAAAAGLALATARSQSHWRVGPRDMIPDRPPRDPLQAAKLDEELERFGQ